MSNGIPDLPYVAADLCDASAYERPVPAPVLGARCGQCRYLQGAGCCAVWIHRVVSSTTDASLCRTFERSEERTP